MTLCKRPASSTPAATSDTVPLDDTSPTTLKPTLILTPELAKAPRKKAPTPLAGYKIIVVDDEPFLLEMIRDELLAQGAEVDEATCGQAAFARASERDYDAVVTDSSMPAGDGAWLAEALKASSVRAKLFLCSGFSSLSMTDLDRLAVVAVFEKPIDFRLMVTTIAAALAPPAST